MKLMERTGAYKEFASRLVDTGHWQIVGTRYVMEDLRLRPMAEIHVWMHDNGSMMVVQTWDDGGYQHYFPGVENNITDTVKEAEAYAARKIGYKPVK